MLRWVSDAGSRANSTPLIIPFHLLLAWSALHVHAQAKTACLLWVCWLFGPFRPATWRRLAVPCPTAPNRQYSNRIRSSLYRFFFFFNKTIYTCAHNCAKSCGSRAELHGLLV